MPDKHFLIQISVRFKVGECVGVWPLGPPPLKAFFIRGKKIQGVISIGVELAKAYAPYAPQLHTPLQTYIESEV